MRGGRKTAEGSEVAPRPDRAVRGQLFDDENVVMVTRPGRLATFPRYLMTLGLYGFWRKRDTSAVTDQRVLLSHGIVRRDERSIPLSHVDDVSVARRGLYSYVNLDIHQRGSTVVERVGPMPPRAARRFAREILRRV